MSRRCHLASALPTVLACVMVLTACGEQTPGGMPAEGRAAEVTSAEATSAGSTAAASDAADPIVVKIGEDEFATIMAIYRRYDDAKGGPLALQAPVAAAEELNGGMSQEFVSGTVFWSPETGAQIVRGQILATYLDNGGPEGRLGWPVSDETTEEAVVYTDFQRGRISLEDQAIRVIEHTS